MNKNDFKKAEAELKKRISELEEREAEIENRAFDLEFNARAKALSEKNRKAEAVLIKADKNEIGLNTLGVKISTDKDSIRPVDSYPSNYYSESDSGNKRIVRFFAENRGRSFSVAEVNKAIGKNRFSSTSALSYFIKESVR